MLDMDGLPLSILNGQWCWRFWVVHQGRFAIVFEIIVNDVIFAFGKFQFLIGSSDDVMP